MFGIPELMIIAAIGLRVIVPLAAGLWVVVTLYKMRQTQDAIDARLARIEQSLARR